MAIPLAIALAPAIIQAGTGVAQAVSGWKQKKELTRPEYQIPEEIEKNVSEAELMSYYGLPDAQKAEFLQNIQRSSAASLRGISERKGGIGAVTAAQQAEQDAYMEMLTEDTRQRMANIYRAQEMRGTLAAYKDKQFSFEMEDYEQKYDEAQALIGAGMQNVMGAVQSGGQMVMAGMKYGQFGGDASTTGIPGSSGSANPFYAAMPGTVTPVPQGQEVVLPSNGMTDLWNTQPNPLFG